MNHLLTKNAMKINGLFNQNTAGVSMLAAVLLTVFSTSTFANRPAMEEHNEMTTGAETQTQAEQATVQTRPESHEPSAVEVMMQQQSQQALDTQQTGDMLQLPAKEMQPGETIRIKLIDFPRRGMTMDKVQDEYGQPSVVSARVGQPPITSWTYNDRVVYFEYSTVLHVVAR